MSAHKTRTAIRMLPAWLTIFLCTPLHAAQLNSASWDEGAAPPTVDLAITGASRYETQVLENGMRLRLVLPDTSLSTDMADLPGRGAVKGVFPYIGGDGSTVNVDFLVNEPARLDVAPASNGLRVAIAGGVAAATATAASGTTSTPPAGGRNTLEDITFAQMPGDRVEIKLHTSTRPAEPGTFSIARPPRISLDLFETGNALGSKSIPVNYGAVESVSTVSANGRTRVVLNLTDAVSFTTRIEDDGVLVAVDSPQAGLAASGRTERRSISAAARTAPARSSLPSPTPASASTCANSTTRSRWISSAPACPPTSNSAWTWSTSPRRCRQLTPSGRVRIRASSSTPPAATTIPPTRPAMSSP
jgi:hypothetical protein